MAQPIPAGFHSVTPAITVRGAAEAIEFYKKAFGAEEKERMTAPDGKTVMHAEIRIGDSIIFIGDEFPGAQCKSPATLGGTSGSLYIYLPDADTTFRRAISAGAKETMPLANMFWGDRVGGLVDPFGQHWSVATHVEDVAPKELEERARAFVSSMQAQKKTA